MKNILKENNNNKGFTLVEMIIVIAIIAIISTLALFNSSKLNSSVLLSNTAYEIGLIIRDAQIAGLGARVISLDEGVAVTANQGIYFDITTPTKIISFVDLDKGNEYSGPTEITQTYDIENKRAGQILGICSTTNIGSGTCNDILDLNIIFKRPNPEAYFYSNNTEIITGSVIVNIGFVGGECKSVIVYKTGAIQIDKSFCP